MSNPSMAYLQGLIVLLLVMSASCSSAHKVLDGEAIGITIPGEIMLEMGSTGYDSSPPGDTRTTVEKYEQCMQRVEALLYAMDTINGDTTVLPGIKLGVRIERYHCTIDIIHIHKPDTRTPNEPDSGTGANQSDNSPTLHIDPSLNLIAAYRGLTGRPSSTDATDVDSESDPVSITALTGKEQEKALTDILAFFNWTYVNYATYQDSESRSRLQRFLAEAKSHNICIKASTTIPAPTGEAGYDIDKNILQMMTADSAEVPVIVTPFSNFMANVYLIGSIKQMINLTDKGFVFVGPHPDAAEIEYLHAAFLEDQIVGSITVKLRPPSQVRFEQHLKNLNPANQEVFRNPFFTPFWETKFGCKLNRALSIDPVWRQSDWKICDTSLSLQKANLTKNAKAERIVEAVELYAKAVHEYLSNSSVTEDSRLKVPSQIDGTLLYDSLLKTSTSADRYEIYNYHKVANGAEAPVLPPHADEDALLRYHESLEKTRGSYAHVKVGEWRESKLDIQVDKVQWPRGHSGFPRSRCSEPCGKGQVKKVIGDSPCCWVCVSAGEAKN